MFYGEAGGGIQSVPRDQHKNQVVISWKPRSYSFEQALSPFKASFLIQVSIYIIHLP